MSYKEKLERADEQLRASGLSCSTDKSFFIDFYESKTLSLNRYTMNRFSRT